MIKKRNVSPVILALLFTSIVFFVSCVQQYPKQLPQLFVRYHYTTEGDNFDLKINDSKIIFTHTDREKIKRKCAQWVIQAPCWTQQDLITEEAQLTIQEITDLKKFIEKTKVMQLKNYYGPKQESRCYPYTLKIDEKKIVYCSGPSSPPKPEAFEKVTAKIQEIVSQKFSK